jgi:DNA-binding NtrC family response regulator
MSELRGDLPVIVQAEANSVGPVIAAMRAGADDFVVKPVDAERLRVSIQNLLRVTALTEEVKRLNQRVSGGLSFDELIASSVAMANVVRLGRRAAPSEVPVLIEGEPGVGKETIARAIAGESTRRSKPFVVVNCGGMPNEQVERTLFGHEAGSANGAAVVGQPGKFREADGGTIFLDEVAELSPGTQLKLLRALETGEVEPPGARKPVKTDIRLIAATSRNMLDMVKAGLFREDLYYRLNVFPIMVPPLGERVEDIPGLVRHFVTRFSAEEGRKIRRIDETALAMLKAYDWPGNVRQLENAVFRAVVLCEGDVLTVDDFPQIAGLVDGYEARVPPAPPPRPKPVLPTGRAAIAGLNGVPAPIGGGFVGDGMALGVAAVTDGGHIRRLEDVEADVIRLALHRYRGQMSEVARKLGIGRSTLYRKMRELGLEAKM